jgi:hypothetical protein
VEKARPATNRKRDDVAPSTKPGHRLAAARAQDPAADKRSEMPTLPPPAATPRESGMRAKRKTPPSPSATVDEVVADLTRDPRREDD